MNQFPFFCETHCGYQKSESHDQNDEISNTLNLSKTLLKTSSKVMTKRVSAT